MNKRTHECTGRPDGRTDGVKRAATRAIPERNRSGTNSFPFPTVHCGCARAQAARYIVDAVYTMNLAAGDVCAAHCRARRVVIDERDST